MLGFDDLWAEGWLKKVQMPFKIGSDLILNVEKAQSVVYCLFFSKRFFTDSLPEETAHPERGRFGF